MLYNVACRSNQNVDCSYSQEHMEPIVEWFPHWCQQGYGFTQCDVNTYKVGNAYFMC